MSTIDYAVPFYLPLKKRDMVRLENVQKRFTKSLFRKGPLSYAEQLKKLKWPSMQRYIGCCRWQFCIGTIVRAILTVVSRKAAVELLEISCCLTCRWLDSVVVHISCGCYPAKDRLISITFWICLIQSLPCEFMRQI